MESCEQIPRCLLQDVEALKAGTLEESGPIAQVVTETFISDEYATLLACLRCAGRLTIFRNKDWNINVVHPGGTASIACHMRQEKSNPGSD